VIAKSQWRRLAGPLATLVLLLASANVLWNSFERSKEAGQSVEHTYRVLVSCERFLSTLRDTESSMRGYVITRNRNFLTPYNAGLETQARIMADLESLTHDNAAQQQNLKAIKALTAQRLAVLAAAAKRVDQGQFDFFSDTTPKGHGMQLMADLTGRLADFEEEEHRLLESRTTAANEAVGRTRFMLVFTSALLALALLLAGAVIERDARTRALAYEALQRQSDLIDFSHDAIVTVNPAGVITGWNAGATEIYGWSSAEALGRPLRETIQTKGFATDIEEALAKTGRWDGELAQTSKDGQARVVESRYVRVRNRAGEPVGMLNISRDATQRKRAEELLNHVAEQRRLALDAADLGSWDYSVEQDRVIWDERCRQIMGLPGLGPASFEQALKVVHPDERETMRAAALLAMSGGAAAGAPDGRFSHEMRILLRDGTVRWLAAYGRVYFEETNGVRRPVRVIGVNSDITKRKRVEDALRESEDRLRVALDTGRIGIFNDLPLENKIELNDRAKELIGVPLETELTPSSYFDLLHPDDREKLIAARRHDLAGTNTDAGELQYRIVRPDGTVRWLIMRRRVYFDDDEPSQRRAVRVLGVMMDITQQKRAEQGLASALRESDQERRRLAALLETMPAGILLADQSNRVLEGNAEAMQIWGAASFQELADRGFDLRGSRAGSAEPLSVEEWPRARALRGEKVVGEIIDIQRFDGRRATIFNSASPILDANGNLQGAVSVMVDVTEQRQIELALRRSEEHLRLAHRELERLLEQKNVLFKEVQHRVKNNLQVVSSLLSLEAQRFEDREFHNALNESRDRVRSMALMHEKFCHLDDLARIEFADYVNELVRYFFSSYISDPSAIGFSSDVDVRLSMDDAIPCGLILQELLSNSVKHAFPNGTGQIQIDFHTVDGKFELRYRDDGVGLPDNVDLANPATLGLQLVTDLAAQLEGNLRYEYRNGAHFTLTFA
jgi:PAS domain S-box-containing protein